MVPPSWFMMLAFSQVVRVGVVCRSSLSRSVFLSFAGKVLCRYGLFTSNTLYDKRKRKEEVIEVTLLEVSSFRLGTFWTLKKGMYALCVGFTGHFVSDDRRV